jgi:NADPH:quinone reductase-like Zn-dependent oxidoreductase
MIRPADGKVFIQEDQQEQRSSIIILLRQPKKEIVGTVVATGENMEYLKEGDRVMVTGKVKKMQFEGKPVICVSENPSNILLCG